MKLRPSLTLSSMALLVTAASVLTVAGCGGTSDGASGVSSAAQSSNVPTAVAQAQEAKSAVAPAIVSSDNAFGISMLKQLAQTSSANVAISPLSLSLVLQVMYAGSAGTTTQAMAQTLQLGTATSATVNSQNAALQASLIDADDSVTLRVANSLWIDQNNTPVLSSFTTMDETYYGATVGDIAGAPENVNAWVDTATNGLITTILPEGIYDNAIIANALYFKGSWTQLFDPTQTTSEPFTRNDGTQVAVPTMHQSGSIAYLQQGNIQIMRLPYGSGRFAMLMVLPDPQAGITGLLNTLTPAQLASWNAGLQNIQLSVAIPKFTARFASSLVPALKSLGMGIVFTSGADFSSLAPGANFSDVEHETVIEVDETGTAAAAATTGSEIDLILSMTLDRPFLYAIEDTKTQELLFIGVLMDPS